MGYEALIKNGSIIDGTGKKRFKADIGIAGGKIVEVGSLGKSGADKVVDVKGLIVCPGFIDMHSHSDITLLLHHRAESSLRQGITTEAVSNCGNSPAPVSDKNREWLLQRLTSSSWVGLDGLNIDWETSGEYMSRLERQGTGVNVAYFVGHGVVRSCVLGLEGEGGEKGWINAQEFKDMKAHVKEAMDAGSFGMTTALRYNPGRNAHPWEVIELCKIVAKHDGLHMSDLRSSGPGGIPTKVEGVIELIQISEMSKVRGHISHHQARNVAEATLRLVDEARARGVDVTCDVYPFTERGASTLMMCFIPQVYHHFITTYKAPKKILEDLRDPDKFKEMEKEANRRNVLESMPYDKRIIVYSKTHPDYTMKTLKEVADLRGEDIIKAARNILLEDEGDTRVTWGVGTREEDLRSVLSHPQSMVSTDGSAHDWFPTLLETVPHPRTIGSYPRVLRKYVREEKLLTFEEAIRKMTSLPAHTLKLSDRGVIEEDMWADITVFNPNTVADMATFSDPLQYPVGIDCVFVNGEIALEKGVPTKITSGKILRHSG